MTDYRSYTRISGLIAAEMLGTISPAGKAELAEWLAQDEENAAIYGRIKARLDAPGQKQYRSDKAVRRAWNQFVPKLERRYRLRSRIRPMLRYAAVFVAAAGLTALLYTRFGGAEHPASITVTPLASGQADAPRLTYPDGTVAIIDKGAGEWTSAEEMIAASGIGAGGAPETYATITVPRGEVLRATIADNIKVHFNSDSELRYELNPTGEGRKLYVRGEVFFDVDGPLAVPLHVYPADGMCIRVLGTSFNVNAYEGERRVTTTLVTGRLEIANDGHTEILEPSQQLVYDRESGSVSKQQVDVRPYTAWTRGQFVFENETLEQIMERLSRWYNVEISYSDDSLRGIRYTGDLERYDELETSLRMLEKVTNIKIDVGDGVTVRNK